MEQLGLRLGGLRARGRRRGLRRGLAFTCALEGCALREDVWGERRVDAEQGGREADGLAWVGRGEGGPGRV